MKLLLSIKPQYSQKILSGEKKYEFRKRKPKQRIDEVFIYESRPSKAIVGSFTVKQIHAGSPEKIWEKCKNFGGIQEKKYFEYCNGSRIIYAFEIDEIEKFKKPIDPCQLIPDFKPPQSYAYLKARIIINLKKKKQIESYYNKEHSLLDFKGFDR